MSDEGARPGIAVVIPCYNAARFIRRTLDCILAQDYPPAEIIVVDDGSTDATAEVLAGYGDRIRVIKMPASGGPSRPRNAGVGAATAGLIAFCDADDLMLPGKLGAAAEAFARQPALDFLFTNFNRCDENEDVMVADYLAEYREFRTHLEPTGLPDLYLMSGSDTWRSLLRANFIGTSSVVCRREVFVASGGFDETMPNAEDIDLWRRIARTGALFGFQDRVGHSYRFRAGSISRGGSATLPAEIRGMERQLDYCSDPRDVEFVRDRLHDLWLGFGYALRREGRYVEAQNTYRRVLSEQRSWAGLRGWLLSRLRIG